MDRIPAGGIERTIISSYLWREFEDGILTFNDVIFEKNFATSFGYSNGAEDEDEYHVEFHLYTGKVYIFINYDETPEEYDISNIVYERVQS